MSARENIMGRIAAALAGVAERRPLPEYPHDVAVARRPPGVSAGDIIGRFCERLDSAGGHAFTAPATLLAWLTARGATRGVCEPALASRLAVPPGAGFTLEPTLDRGRVDDYHFGVTRAVGAIAETGTLVLTDAGTSSRLAALAPWIHVAVLDARHIHASVADAIAVLGGDPNVIWCTGPSKTADVEGILIEGVHGPGEQVALILG